MALSSETIELLKEDHNKIRKQISVLLEKDATLRKKRQAFSRLVPILESHCEREEAVVYNFMKNCGEDLKKMALEGETEHSLGDRLVHQLKNTTLNPDTWHARAKVLGELLKHHIDEEEKDVFPKLKKHLDRGIDKRLSAKYEAVYVKHPMAPREHVSVPFHR
jgi:hemerythrin-like domain-containing protein